MAVKGRHIRHDWKTFTDWPQKTVKGACGVTTKRDLAGIPGITEQPESVPSGGKSYWGWCAQCVSVTFHELERTNPAIFIPEVAVLWERVSLVVSPQYYAMKAQADRRRQLRREGHKVNVSHVV